MTHLGEVKWLIFLTTLPWLVTPWACVGMCLHAQTHTSRAGGVTSEPFTSSLSPPAQIPLCQKSLDPAHCWPASLTCQHLSSIFSIIPAAGLQR